MKKLIALLLLAAMVVCLSACTKAEAEEGKWVDPTAGTGFRVGFGRVDITNRDPVPMAGYGNTTTRVNTSIGTRLYANCVAVTTADDQTVFFVDVDYQRASGSKLKVVEEWIEERLGIPGTNLIVTSTHTHAAADFTVNGVESIEQTVEIYREGIFESCVLALEDRKPAEVYIGSIETERMNFVRHYSYVDENGETQFFGDSFGTQTLNETTKHATDADPTMYVIQFKREGAKDIIMASFRAHAHMNTSADSKVIDADFPARIQQALEAKYDCHFGYYQGFAGNINAKSRISADMRTQDVNEYGAIMADYILDCIANNMKKVDTCDLLLRQDTLDLEANHTTDDLLLMAKNVQAIWKSTGDKTAAVAAGKEYGIRSVYHAGAIVSRASTGPTVPVEVTTISFSPQFAIATCVGEPFDTLGEYVEERSPYETTITFGYTNGEAGYMPSAYGWEYTCYESDTTKYCPGSGEEVMDHIIEMLKDIHSR